MVDSVEHLDLIDRATDRPVRLCLDLDAGYWRAGGRVKVGPKRSPLHTPEQARELALEIARRPRLRLVALMSYEGHIAGFGDQVAGKFAQNAIVRWMQRESFAELRERRARAVELVSEVAELEIVNAGGTGDLQLVAHESAVTEATAGSGFYAPTLFDSYSAFSLQPAAMFALPICRRPEPRPSPRSAAATWPAESEQKTGCPAPICPAG
ncbi:alanine racemase, N-terminal domain protein [Mycobacterium ulcerans str. Harvey]|uniref:Alanine racemase, N-terminal domain protein n=1 Tax=Mycobacterium ulcerans str. Harvey TaxID=1299332 RepID=A0ABP3ARN3_MYCUL|nr:alanine racemase, N-terminal domain protein [Mycobacterium ulcerans str. Harvey]